MREKSEIEKVLELLAHFNVDAHQFFFEKFTIGSAMSDATKNYIRVKEAFLKKFAHSVEPQDIIWQTTNANHGSE